MKIIMKENRRTDYQVAVMESKRKLCFTLQSEFVRSFAQLSAA